MTPSKRYDRIAFVASTGVEAEQALAQLVRAYGNHDPADADVIVALGGDGFMLETMHNFIDKHVPMFGMHRGSIGFLMNTYAPDGLTERLAQCAAVRLHPLSMRATCGEGKCHSALAINDVALLRRLGMTPTVLEATA